MNQAERMRVIVNQGSIFDVLAVQDMLAERAACRAKGLPARLLILQCGASKARDAGRMPARDRYTGPLWQSLKKAEPVVNGSTFVAALSARYGLVDGRTGIEDYDAVLNDRSAAAMIRGGAFARVHPAVPAAGEVVRAIVEERGGEPLEEICIVGGHRYVAVAEAWAAEWRALGFLAPEGRVVVINDEIGRMRQRMAAWIREDA